VWDRLNNRIQVFGKDGTYIKECTVEPRTAGNGSVWDIVLSWTRSRSGCIWPTAATTRCRRWTARPERWWQRWGDQAGMRANFTGCTTWRSIRKEAVCGGGGYGKEGAEVCEAVRAEVRVRQ
jgi:hypothetical protein